MLIPHGIISTLSSPIIKPKLCIDCKFFRGDFLLGNKFGKCSKFPIEDDYDDRDYLVDGIKGNKKIDYTYCSISRKYNHMCGENGNLFEKK